MTMDLDESLLVSPLVNLFTLIDGEDFRKISYLHPQVPGYKGHLQWGGTYDLALFIRPCRERRGLQELQPIRLGRTQRP